MHATATRIRELWAPAEHRLALLAFLVAVAYWGEIFSAPWMPRWWVLAIGLPLLFSVRPRVDALTGFLTVSGFVWAVAATALSDGPFDGVLPLAFLFLVILAGIAASQVDRLELALAAMSWGVAISTLVGILQAAGQSTIAHTGAPGGLFFSSEVFAELAAPLFVWAFLTRRHELWALMLIPLFICNSRIAIAAAVIGFLYAWRPERRWVKWLACGVAVCLACLAVVALGLPKLSTAGHRIVLWGAAVQSITPLGQGFGWWAAAHPFGYEEFAHSDALQILVEAGAGGLLLLALPFILIRGADRQTGACFAALCFEAVVSFPVHMPASGLLFGMLAGFLAGRRAVVRVGVGIGGAHRNQDLRRAAPHGQGVADRRRSYGGEVPVRSTLADDARAYPPAGFGRARGGA